MTLREYSNPFEIGEIEVSEDVWFAAWGTHYWTTTLTDFDPECGPIETPDESRLEVEGVVAFDADDNERRLTDAEVKVWCEKHRDLLMEHVRDAEQAEDEARAEAAAEARYGMY